MIFREWLTELETSIDILFLEMSRVDDDLVSSYKAGDKSSLDKLIIRWEPRLLMHIRKIIGNRTHSPQDAEDISQSTMMKIANALESGHEPDNFAAWAYTIARNEAYGYYRKKHPEPTGEPEERFQAQGGRHRGRDSAPMGRRNPEEDPANIASDQEKYNILHRALKELGGVHEDILRRRYFGFQKYQQIADELNIPVGTVRSRVHDARKRLKEFLTTKGVAD